MKAPAAAKASAAAKAMADKMARQDGATRWRTRAQRGKRYRLTSDKMACQGGAKFIKEQNGRGRLFLAGVAYRANLMEITNFRFRKVQCAFVVSPR